LTSETSGNWRTRYVASPRTPVSARGRCASPPHRAMDPVTHSPVVLFLSSMRFFLGTAQSVGRFSLGHRLSSAFLPVSASVSTDRAHLLGPCLPIPPKTIELIRVVSFKELVQTFRLSSRSIQIVSLFPLFRPVFFLVSSPPWPPISCPPWYPLWRQTGWGPPVSVSKSHPATWLGEGLSTPLFLLVLK